jgi:hypothetical protein
VPKGFYGIKITTLKKYNRREGCYTGLPFWEGREKTEGL